MHEIVFSGTQRGSHFVGRGLIQVGSKMDKGV